MCVAGGCAWFYSGGMRGFIRGACVVLCGGRVWFYAGGACMVLFGGCMVLCVGGACMVLCVGGMHGFIQGGMHGFMGGGALRCYIWGACVADLGGIHDREGNAWFYGGHLHGFIQGGVRDRGACMTGGHA